MDALQLALELIKHSEGLRLKAYQDTGGVWTIGYGHTGKSVHEGLMIDQHEADALCITDALNAQRSVQQLCPILMAQPYKQAAIIDFVYNLGAQQFSTSTLCRYINSQQYEHVPEQLLRWIHDNGKVLPGLVRRREAEVALWNT